jgi:protein O-GlcNAc transferase
MGAEHIDYIIADRTVIVSETREFYAEKVVYLPHTYYPNDARQLVFGEPPTRSACNLPDAAFVFCCFNNNFKITPAVFHLWMNILLSVEGSVLWLLEDNEISSANLRRAARALGVSEARLLFAKRAPPPEHLARHRLVDLFLDTLPYNAHTTACDALWAGAPVLTRIGETFPGRVCASLLKAMGLPELITTTPEEYQRRAIKLATVPAELEAIRSKLEQNRETAPLFDTNLYTRHLESAYEEMYRRYRAGLPPEDIYVPEPQD